MAVTLGRIQARGQRDDPTRVPEGRGAPVPGEAPRFQGRRSGRLRGRGAETWHRGPVQHVCSAPWPSGGLGLLCGPLQTQARVPRPRATGLLGAAASPLPPLARRRYGGESRAPDLGHWACGAACSALLSPSPAVGPGHRVRGLPGQPGACVPPGSRAAAGGLGSDCATAAPATGAPRPSDSCPGLAAVE